MSNDALLKSARQAIQAGQKQQARDLLQQAIRQNPQDHRPWLWLAGITRSARASLDYVNRAAALRPNDPVVQKAQAWAERRLSQEQSQAGNPATALATAAAAAPVPPPAPRSEAVTMPLPAVTPPAAKPVAERPTQPLPRPAAPAPRRTQRDWGMATVTAVGFFSLLAFLVAGLVWWQTMGPGQATANDALSNDLPNPNKQAAVIYGNLEIPPTATPTATPDPLQPKAAVEDGQARATWTITPRPRPPSRPRPRRRPPRLTIPPWSAQLRLNPGAYGRVKSG